MDKALEKIYKCGLKLLSSTSPEKTYKLVVREGMKLVGADYGSILLDEKGVLKRVYASDSMLYQIKPRPKGFMFNVFQFNQPKILSSRGIIKIHPEIQALNIQSDLMVPISNKGKTIGVLTLMSKKDKFFTKRDMQTLKLFGQMATLAIMNVQLYNETKTALESRDLFISMASHELRTPLTTISGYAQLLNTRSADLRKAESRWVKELLTEVNKLALLMDELLEVNNIKTGELQYNFELNSLREVIGKVTANFNFMHPNHRIIFDDNLSGKDLVIGDFNKLIQVFSNLLDNAAKFSFKKKEISIILKHKSPYLVVSIQDWGIGIPKKDLTYMFDKFKRGTNHLKEGMGLGLFLVKNIINQHHGKVTINSAVAEGTTVEVKLPKVKL